MAYDAGLKNQSLLRRWQFRANAMTVVAAFALTVSVGLHWRVLSEWIFPAGEYPARLVGNETHTAMTYKAEGVSSSMQGGSPRAAEERGDAPNKSPELNAEPSYALPDRSSAKELVDGSLAQPTTAEAPIPNIGQSGEQRPQSWRRQRNDRTAKLAAPSPQQSRGRERGWMVGHSINVAEGDSATTLIEPSVKRASSAATVVEWARSTSLRGFAPGYMVVVIGPFADKADAARSQQQVNRCVSGTYVKYAQHLGERG